ncbi:hypothetical protein J1614_004650 [Plenodomus biglobosus]|nr:hypothetical protein J1614_004650 [Plenodomus biglobosus]
MRTHVPLRSNFGLHGDIPQADTTDAHSQHSMNTPYKIPEHSFPAAKYSIVQNPNVVLMYERVAWNSYESSNRGPP